MSLIRAPMVCSDVKSKGVPSTGTISPVGMEVSSIGVIVSHDILTFVFRMSPEPLPSRLKYEWFARFSGVGAEVVAVMSILSSFSSVSVYVTETETSPG